MTIYVTRSKQRGKGCIKPEALNPAFTDGENLHYLISRNPDCIYYSDDPEADLFGAGEIVETMAVTYEVWERDLANPQSLGRPSNLSALWGGFETKKRARFNADQRNKDEGWRGRYEFYPVKVTTTRKIEKI